MMQLVELYNNGNIRCDIEPEDRMAPKMRKSTATIKYDCSMYTEELNKLIEARREREHSHSMETTASTRDEDDMPWKNAPWNCV